MIPLELIRSIHKMNQHDLYRLFRGHGEESDRARRILEQRHWFTSLASFDPRTGDVLPLGLGKVLRRLATADDSNVIKDRLWRITDHSRSSVDRILKALNEAPRRDHASLPFHKVRDLDATSFVALSRRSGRNVREKLADKPYLYGVRRFQSVDLPHNQLFKEFVTRLVELLELREVCFGVVDPLTTNIHRWLRSDEARSISRWQNLPANNTLLSHRDYRSVWDAWRWLQVLDDEIARDESELAVRDTTIARWQHLATSFLEEETLFGEVPVLFDYEAFTIEPWTPHLLRRSMPIKRRETTNSVVTEATCVDLTSLRPKFATSSSNHIEEVNEQFIWQVWCRDSRSVNLELFNADLAVLHPDSLTVTAPDLLLGSALEDRLLDSAALAFTNRLRSIFPDSKLIWLQADFSNDFELTTMRRNINSRFTRADQLPRSVAAVFETLSHSSIPNAGYVMAVFDKVGGISCATRLIAQHSPKLERVAPETRGFYWEREPSITLDSADTPWDSLSSVPRFATDGQYVAGSSPKNAHASSDSPLNFRTVVGDFDDFIVLTGSPVRGGIRWHELNKHAGGIPLWCNKIPELRIKVIIGGLQEMIPLVARTTRIEPIRGKTIEIPLPATSRAPIQPGVPRVDFPLYQGRSTARIGFDASLTSPMFPLKEPKYFKLRLTYTYGDDQPYALQFLAETSDGGIDADFPPIKATFKRITPLSGAELGGLPIPKLAERLNWDALRTWTPPNLNSKTMPSKIDLLEDVEAALFALTSKGRAATAAQREEKWVQKCLLKIRASRVEGTVVSVKKIDKNGRAYLWIRVNGESIFCHEQEFLENVNIDTIRPGARAFLMIDRKNANQGTFVAFKQQTQQDLETSLRSRYQTTIRPLHSEFGQMRKAFYRQTRASHTVWSEGRSISDVDCPTSFRDAVRDGVDVALKLYKSDEITSGLKNDLFKFLSRLHKDAPSDIVAQLATIAKKREHSRMESLCLAWSIGDCSEGWQQDILQRVLRQDFSDVSLVLSICLLKCRDVVDQIDAQQIATLLERLGSEMDGELMRTPDSLMAQNCVQILEVLLGLLFARRSDDSAIKVLLAPDRPIGLAFTDRIDRFARIIRDHALEVNSRVSMNDEKSPDEAWQPDLLVAVRHYLTGRDNKTALRFDEWYSDDYEPRDDDGDD